MKKKYKDQPLPFTEYSNAGKIILDLCGGTGAWSKPYAEAGYTVIIITKPLYDVFDVRTEGKLICFPCKDGMTQEDIYVDVQKVVGILAAPTCTQFSIARTTAKTERDLLEGFKLVQQCLNIIHYVRQHGVVKNKAILKFWSLENPMGFLRQMLGLPPLTFNPSDYGDTYTKKTDLWGYYKMPRMKPVPLTAEAKAKCAINNRDLPNIPEGYVMPDDIKSQAVRRSITSEYFARAFFKANKP